MKTEQDWENYHESEDQKIMKKRFKRFKRMLIWLAVWLQDFLRLKTSFKMPKEDSRMKPVNDGQIVINKGYTPRPEGLKPL